MSDTEDKMANRPYPELLSDEEKSALLTKAENLWGALEENKLGGFSGINRPFLIFAEFKAVIEEYGRREVGLTWSYNDLAKSRAKDVQKQEVRDEYR